MDEHPSFQRVSYEYIAESLMNGHVIFQRQIKVGTLGMQPFVRSPHSPVMSFATYQNTGGGRLDSSRVSSGEVFFICGGDHSRLYCAITPTTVIAPKTLLWQSNGSRFFLLRRQLCIVSSWSSWISVANTHGHQHRVAAPTVLLHSTSSWILWVNSPWRSS